MKRTLLSISSSETVNNSVEAPQQSCRTFLLDASLAGEELDKAIREAAGWMAVQNNCAVADYLGVELGADAFEAKELDVPMELIDVKELDTFEVEAEAPILGCSLTAVKTDKGYGIVDEHGEVVVAPTMDAVETEAVNGFVLFEKKGKQGVVVTYPVLPHVVEAEYDEIYNEGFPSELIVVKDGVEGYLSRKGQFVSKEDFERLSDEEHDDFLEDVISSHWLDF